MADLPSKLPVAQDTTEVLRDGMPLPEDPNQLPTDIAPDQVPIKKYDEAVQQGELFRKVGSTIYTTGGDTVSTTIIEGGGGGTPGGSDTQVQFNDSNSFGGDADLTWNKTTGTLYVGDSAGVNLNLHGGSTFANILGSDGSGIDGTAIHFKSGTGGTDKDGGLIEITTGDGDGTGDGGPITIRGGDGGGTSGIGGSVVLYGGYSYGDGNGDIVLKPGANDNTSGGDCIVQLTNNASANATFQISNNGIAGGNISYRKVMDGLTEDGTPQNLDNVITLDASQAVLVETRIVARRVNGLAGTDGDSAMYVRRAGFKRKSTGNASQVGTTQNVFTAEDQAGWDVDILLSTNDVIIQITGATNNNILWSVETFWITSTTG